MQKLWLGLALVSALTVGAAAGAFAAGGARKNIEVEFSGINITVDDKAVDFKDPDLEPFIYLEKSKTFVAARPLAEAMGGKVDWVQATNTVTVYTPTYATSKLEGDLRVWSMPARGVSIATPRNFFRLDNALFPLQLASIDFTTGEASFVALSRQEPGTGMTLREELDAALIGLKQTILPDVTIAEVTEENGKLTAVGKAMMFGNKPVALRLRMVAAEGGDWAVMVAVPEGQAAAMNMTVTQILDSFSLQSK